MKFTFKKEPKETGLASVGAPYPNVLVKFNKLVVGQIIAPTWRDKDHKWMIRLMFKDGESWKWRTVKDRFDNELDARNWLQERVETISKWDLHGEDPKDW